MEPKRGKEALKTIAEKFRDEIKRIDSVLSEIHLSLEEENAIELISRMGLVYLMTYLEAFNREYFIKFFSDKPHIMAKQVENPKDQKKLVMEYKDLIEEIYGYEESDLTEKMAEKLYDKIFDYHRVDINTFITKLLEGFLELDFHRENQKYGIDIEMLKRFRAIRNSIIHYKEDNFKEDISFRKCHNIIVKYISLVEELIYNKYYPPQISHEFEL